MCGFINTIFLQPCMAGESTKTNLSISFFSKFLVKLLRNSIKQVVSRAVLRALSGVLKAALLKAMAFQSAF